jgi:hypothetical protein
MQKTYRLHIVRFYTDITTGDSIQRPLLSFCNTLCSQRLPSPRSSMQQYQKTLAFAGNEIRSRAEVMSMRCYSSFDQFLGLSRDNKSPEGVFVPCYISDIVDADKSWYIKLVTSAKQS